MPLTLTNAAIHPEDTIVAVSSAQGSGRRAIVRISGPNTTAAIKTVFTSQKREEAGFRSDRRLIPGSIQLSGVHSPVPATLYFFRGPQTYTGQDLA